MKSNEIYNAWKEKKSQVEIGTNFTDKVIEQINRCEQAQGRCLFNMQQFGDFISAHLLARAALVAAGLVAGIIRIGIVVCVFLQC